MKTLVKQGRFLDLATAQHEDVVWKSYMFDLKQGTLKFPLNASLDTLPTDVTQMNTSVICFEIGSRGFISTRNQSSLNALHKFVKPELKL